MFRTRLPNVSKLVGCPDPVKMGQGHMSEAGESDALRPVERDILLCQGTYIMRLLNVVEEELWSGLVNDIIVTFFTGLNSIEVQGSFDEEEFL